MVKAGVDGINKKVLVFLLLLVFLIPYGSLFQDYANVIICFVATVYMLFILFKGEAAKEKLYLIKGDKHEKTMYRDFLVLMLGFSVILSLYINGFRMESLMGTMPYVGFGVFYIILRYNRQHKELIYCWLVNVTTVFSAIYILYQGAFMKGNILAGRIDGNVGYANSYALLLLIILYLNEIKESKKFDDIIQIVLIIGIVFTGSRNTLLYLAVFYAIKIFQNIKFKKKDNCVFNIIIGLVVYLVLDKLGFEIVFVFPLIMIIVYFVLENVSYKVKKYGIIAVAILALIVVVSSSTGVKSRLSSMSFKSNELQQRFVYFGDALSQVKKNHYGNGINTFVYKQCSEQSAYYDVRYVHNSVLQVAYDIGFEGGLVFVLLLIYGFTRILKSKDRHKLYLLALYLSIVLHSLLDFDFAYMFTWIALVMLVAFSQDFSYVDAECFYGVDGKQQLAGKNISKHQNSTTTKLKAEVKCEARGKNKSEAQAKVKCENGVKVKDETTLGNRATEGNLVGTLEGKPQSKAKGIGQSGADFLESTINWQAARDRWHVLLKLVGILLLAYSSYLLVAGSLDYLGTSFEKSGDYITARSLFKADEKITTNNSGNYLKLGGTYMDEGYEKGDKSNFEKAIEQFKKGEAVNSVEPRILNRLMVCYSVLDKAEETIEYYDKLTTDRKYYYDIYKDYYSYLSGRYNSTKDKKYLEAMDALDSKYRAAMATIPSKNIAYFGDLPKSLK